MKNCTRGFASTLTSTLSTLAFSVIIASSLSACGGGNSASNTAVTPTAPDTSGSANIVALQIKDTVIGSGAMAGPGNVISVNYTGWLYDVTQTSLHSASSFDSSIGRGPFTFVLGAGQVIQGWDKGVVGMRVGGKRTLTIPSSMAYGTAGSPPRIPANAALVFEVELLAVQ